MGLLDDAIREHLDLKRRRGADPDEVARLEHEALGPVRREPLPVDTEPAAADPTHVLPPEERHEGAHGDPLREAAPQQPSRQEPAHAAHEQLATAPADTDRPSVAERDDPAVPLAESPRATTAPSRGDAEPKRPEPAAADPDEVHDILQPTTEFRVEDHHDEDPQEPATGPAEDVLEETPEFLQETPEHDRLWFEQRPPRDFDFDG
jgi:hypothetical protein